MSDKKVKDSRRVLEVQHLANDLVVKLNLTKKVGEQMDLITEKLSKMLAILLTETEDELEIAKLWITFEDDIARMRGVKKEATQLPLTLTETVKSDGKKQRRNNTKEA